MSKDLSSNGDPEDEYESVLMLDELESLLEEIEEQENPQTLPGELKSELSDLGLANVGELRSRIRMLHQRLDSQEKQ